MKKSLLRHPLWMRSSQFHPRLWDYDDYGLGWYGRIDRRYKPIRRQCCYRFKEWRHMHLSNK